MATTGRIGAETHAAVMASPLYGAGAGPHMPVGTWSGARFRSMLRFVSPAWAGWTDITSATLTFYITDFAHVGPRNSAIWCRRENAPIWTKASGSQNCNSGFSASNTTQWGDTSSASATDQVGFSSGTTANKAITLDVTAIVKWHMANNASRIVFLFDEQSGSDYTEIWSEDATDTTVRPTLVINYEVQSPPTAPTNLAPAAGAVVSSQNPTFSWQHNDPQSDPQAQANVQLYDAGGTAIGAAVNVAGVTASLVWPTALARGTTYQWAVQTADASSGFGPYSAKQSFTVKALPVVTIDATRRMLFSSGAPRLQVNWSADQPQGRYRVQVAAPVFDSGWIAGAATSYVLDGVPVVDNVAQAITVSVENTDASPLQGSATRSFTPRYGLTVHRRDLGAAPVNWTGTSVVSTVPPGATLQIEYGSNPAAVAAPTAWFSALGSAPKARYVFWRAWFIPSSTASPTLDTITISSDATVQVVDKWGTAWTNAGDAPSPLPAAWSIDSGEAVYGTRSLRCDRTAASFDVVYSQIFRVRAGRSYILSGLMKSQGNSGAQIRLQDGTQVYTQTPQITAVGLTDWFSADSRDVNRYRSPVWVAPNDMDVFVSLICQAPGVAGSTAWFDGVKVEESTVATPWSPSAVGAVVLDAGGVQVDANKGGVLRVRGSTGGVRDVVESGAHGLLFGSDTELFSQSPNQLTTPQTFFPQGGSYAPFHYSGFGTLLRIVGDANSGGKWAKIASGSIPGQYNWQLIRGTLMSRYTIHEIECLVASDGGVTVQPSPVYVNSRSPISGGYGQEYPVKLIVQSLNPIVWSLWISPNGGYEDLGWFPEEGHGGGAPPPDVVNPGGVGWVATASLPAGTQYNSLPRIQGNLLVTQGLAVGAANLTGAGNAEIQGHVQAGGYIQGSGYGNFAGGVFESGVRLLQPAGLRIQSGSATPASSGSGEVSSQLAVVFPVAFSGVPVLMLTTANYNWYAGTTGAAPTASGFTFAVRRVGQATGGGCLTMWLAIGPA